MNYAGSGKRHPGFRNVCTVGVLAIFITTVTKFLTETTKK